MSISAQSEQALAGALAQWPSVVLTVCEKLGLTESSFNETVCRTVFTTVARMATTEKVVLSDMVLCELGDDMATVAEYTNLCPSATHAEYHAGKVREAEQRRNLSETVRGIGERLEKGGAIDVLAEQLKAAGEAVASKEVDKQSEIVCAADFMNSPIDDPPEVIQKLLRAQQVGMMSAGSKAGKSWALLDLSCAVATGANWLKWKTTRGRVLFINAELSPFDLQQRIEKIVDAMGLPCVPSNLDLWQMKGVHTTIGELIPAIVKRQEAVGIPYVLIVPDPLYSFHGDRDENSNSEMAVTMRELAELSEKTGAACWISHHFSKGGQSGKDHLDRGSGAGVLSRSPDTIMTLTAHKIENCYSVESTCRSFARPEPFVVEWSYPQWRVADGLDAAELKRPNSGRAAQYTVDQIVELLPAEGMKHKAWMEKAEEEIGIKSSAFNALLKVARDSKMVGVAFGLYTKCEEVVSHENEEI